MSETPHQPGPNPQDDFLAAWHDIPGVIPDGSANPDSSPQSPERTDWTPFSQDELDSMQVPQDMLDREAENIDRHQREQQSRRAVQRASTTAPQPAQTPAPSAVQNMPQSGPDDIPSIVEHGFGRFTLRPWERSNNPFGSRSRRRQRTPEEQAQYNSADRAGRKVIRAEEKTQLIQERVRDAQNTADSNAQRIQDTAADKVQRILQKAGNKPRQQAVADDKIRRTQEIADDKARRLLESAAYKAEQAGKRVQRINDRLHAPTRKQQRLAEQEELRRRQLKAEAEAAKGKSGLKVADISEFFDDDGRPLPITVKTRENLSLVDVDTLRDQNTQERRIAHASALMRAFFSPQNRAQMLGNPDMQTRFGEKFVTGKDANSFDLEEMTGYRIIDVSDEYKEIFGSNAVLVQGSIRRRTRPLRTNRYQQGTGNNVYGYKSDEVYELRMYSARVIPSSPGERGKGRVDFDSVKPLDVPLPLLRWTLHQDEQGQDRVDETSQSQNRADQIIAFVRYLRGEPMSDEEREEIIARSLSQRSAKAESAETDPMAAAAMHLMTAAQLIAMQQRNSKS